MTPNRDELKRAAAMRAIEEVGDGMVLGLGTGSTAAFVVEGLARRVAAGLRVVGIPTSERTAVQAAVPDAFHQPPPSRTPCRPQNSMVMRTSLAAMMTVVARIARAVARPTPAGPPAAL